MEQLALDPEDFYRSLVVGVEVATITIIVTIILELFSWQTAIAAFKKDKSLYLTALYFNFKNHYVLGIPVYVSAAVIFLRKDDRNGLPISPIVTSIQVLGVLLVHSLCYYFAHKTFHSCPGYYKYHKFHHRFNTHVPPSAANAVGFVEYLFAYVLPFAVAAAVVRPYEFSIRIAIYIISMANLSIHTPKIEAWSEKYMPSWVVSTHDHLEHHRKLNIHYAAPTMNIDWAAEKWNEITAKRVPQSSVEPLVA